MLKFAESRFNNSEPSLAGLFNCAHVRGCYTAMLTYRESTHKRNLLRKLRVCPGRINFWPLIRRGCYPYGVKVPMRLSLTTKVKVLNR